MRPSSLPARASAIAVALLLASAVAAEPIILRVDAPMTQPNGISAAPAVSANGRVVAFRSTSSNLVAGSGTSTLFAYDVVLGTIAALASTANGNLFDPAISADGRFVAFEASANNLAPGIDSQFSDVLRLDRETGEFVRASQGFGGTQANGGSAHAAISGDGRWVAFTSVASNLVARTTTGNRRHVYVMDMNNGFVDLATRGLDGTEGDRDALALEANAMSGDGRRLVFTTQAENLAPVFAGNVSDVIVRTRDPDTGAISFENVNRSVDGAVGTQSSSRGSISPNGRYVVFRSNAPNLLARQASDSRLYVRDLEAGTLRVLPAPTGHGTCDRARISDRGDVLMQCAPTAGSSTALQVFRVAAAGGAPQLMSFTSTGAPGNASSGQAFTLSADGTVMAIESVASDLVPGDTNVAGDVFIVAEPDRFDRIFHDSFE